MSGPPQRPEDSPMRDEMSDAWAAYDSLVRRTLELDEIAGRLAATSADAAAVADYWVWKADGD